MVTSQNERLREQREEVVRRHVAAENTGDLDGMIASFHRPRYQVIPMGAVTDGEIAVREVGEYFIDDHMRNIPNHWHAHARPKGGFFGRP